MGYFFDKRVVNGPYTVAVDTQALYGWFEHETYGEQRGGGLWFQRSDSGQLELTDFDGLPALPKKVGEALLGLGFIIEDDFF